MPGLRTHPAPLARRQGTLSNRSLTWLAAAATLVLLVVFALVPDCFTNRMPTISSIRYALRYQAHLREEFAALIQRAGGAAEGD